MIKKKSLQISKSEALIYLFYSVQYNKNINPNDITIDLNDEKISQMQIEKEEKKFVAFGGEGFLVSNVNVDGLYVKKDLKKSINQRIPVYHFNIRLFNGEIIKCEFNQTHTLKDVYIYVKKISGSNNFVLLEGFPPRPLDQYNKTIKELKLENTTLTQKISENTYYY